MEEEGDNFFGSSLLHGHVGTGAPADAAPGPEADAELQAQVLAEMSAEELQKELVGVSSASSSTLASVTGCTQAALLASSFAIIWVAYSRETRAWSS